MAAPPKLTIDQLNTSDCTVTGLRKSTDGTYLDGAATVTVTVKDRSGALIIGPITLNYQAGAATPGTFSGEVDSTFDPTKGSGYTTYLEATDPDGKKLHIERQTEVGVRSE